MSRSQRIKTSQSIFFSGSRLFHILEIILNFKILRQILVNGAFLHRPVFLMYRTILVNFYAHCVWFEAREFRVFETIERKWNAIWLMWRKFVGSKRVETLLIGDHEQLQLKIAQMFCILQKMHISESMWNRETQSNCSFCTVCVFLPKWTKIVLFYAGFLPFHCIITATSTQFYGYRTCTMCKRTIANYYYKQYITYKVFISWMNGRTNERATNEYLFLLAQKFSTVFGEFSAVYLICAESRV